MTVIRYKSKLVEFESFAPLGSAERNADYTQAESAQTETERKATIGTEAYEKGQNIALFDLNSAKFKVSKLYKFAIDSHGAFGFRPVNCRVFCSDQIPED